MRTVKIFIAGSLVLLGICSTYGQKPSVVDAGWLAGCWSGQGYGKEFSEQWMAPKGGVMLGMGRTVKNDTVTEYEFTEIRKNADGEIYYVAHPSGQTGASFKLVKFAAKELVFENPAHDFPQRVIYRLATDGSLMARIEGNNNGKLIGIDFPMKPAKCGMGM